MILKEFKNLAKFVMLTISKISNWMVLEFGIRQLPLNDNPKGTMANYLGHDVCLFRFVRQLVHRLLTKLTIQG
jgi:hypothetical protein